MVPGMASENPRLSHSRQAIANNQERGRIRVIHLWIYTGPPYPTELHSKLRVCARMLLTLRL